MKGTVRLTGQVDHPNYPYGRTPWVLVIGVEPLGNGRQGWCRLSEDAIFGAVTPSSRASAGREWLGGTLRCASPAKPRNQYTVNTPSVKRAGVPQLGRVAPVDPANPVLAAIGAPDGHLTHLNILVLR
jgi:hypothetical protein